MQNLVNVIVATTTACLVPAVVVDHIPPAEPLSYTVAQVVELPSEPEEEEGKPLPPVTPSVKPRACNCYNILKDTFGEVPLMSEVIAAATEAEGNVAVFKYPATEEWPNGIPHVALVKEKLPDGSLKIEEYNYHSCTHSERIITPHDRHLVGFTTL